MKREISSAVKLSLILTTSIIAMAKDSKPRVYQSMSLLKNESLEENNSLDINDDPYNTIDRTVYFAPIFKNGMSPVKSINVSAVIILDCRASGNPKPNITWFKNMEPIVWGSSYYRPFDDSWIVYIEHPTENYIGNYTCVVCNELGCMERSVELVHKETDKEHPNYGHINDKRERSAPRFKHPAKLYMMDMKPAGNSIIIKCAAEGNPTPNITWYKNNVTPISRDYLKPWYGKWSMSLQELTRADNGNYTCVVCNELGCIEHTMVLHVQERSPSMPYIKEGYPGNITVLVNDTVTLTCPPVADLEPYRAYVYWVRPYNNSMKDVEVGTSDNPIPTGEVKESENRDDKPEHLTLYNVTKEDEGWYVCVALNTLGYTTAKGYLTVLELKAHAMMRSWVIPTVITGLGALLFMVVIVLIAICMKLQKERRQKDLAIEMAAEVVEILWKKKVMIQKPQLSESSDADRPLLKPVVRIEKLKVTRLQNHADDSTVMTEYELPEDNDWEIPRETLVLDKVLGEGEFGKVIKAECVGALKGGRSIVAVKMLKEEHTDADMKALVSEMEIMKLVGKHVNIINLLGCCTQNGPLYVVIEFASQGCLREFLRKHRPGNGSELVTRELEGKRKLTQKHLVSFSYQVAKGMEYLASKQCVHRDLAARNVLVSDAWVLKIADFGLARDVQDSNYYRKKTAGKLPARWMAPESLCKMMFTVETDVWSFGVLMWEIMTLGVTPYLTVQGQYLYEHLRTGHRLDKPPCCRLDVYMLMRECWSFYPRGRPSFTKLVENLDKILTLTSNESSQPTSDRCPSGTTNGT